MFVPATAMLVMLSAAVPVLDSVTTLAALVVPTVCLPNASEVGERLATGVDVPDETPLPVRLIFWGLPVALSVMVTLPVRVPVAVGLKVTLIAQLEPGASEVPQVPS